MVWGHFGLVTVCLVIICVCGHDGFCVVLLVAVYLLVWFVIVVCVAVIYYSIPVTS